MTQAQHVHVKVSSQDGLDEAALDACLRRNFSTYARPYAIFVLGGVSPTPHSL